MLFKTQKLNKFKKIHNPRLFSLPTIVSQNNGELASKMHDFNNKVKVKIGNFFGISIHTIADNDKLIEEILSIKKSNSYFAREYNIEEFIKANTHLKKTTVFFNNHWVYRFGSLTAILWFFGDPLISVLPLFDLNSIIIFVVHIGSAYVSMPKYENSSLCAISKYREQFASELIVHKTVNKE